MRIYALNTLKEFWNKYPDSEINLLHWYGRIAKDAYNNPQHIVGNFIGTHKGYDKIDAKTIEFN